MSSPRDREVTLSALTTGLAALMVATVLVFAGTVTAQTATPTPIDCSIYDDKIAALDAEYENISQAETEALNEWVAERDAMYALDPEDRPKTIAEVDQEYFPGKWERLDRQNEINEERSALQDQRLACLYGSQAPPSTSGTPGAPAAPATPAPSTPSGSDLAPTTGGLTGQESPPQSGTPVAPSTPAGAPTPASGATGSDGGDGSVSTPASSSPQMTPAAPPASSVSQESQPTVEQPLSPAEAGAAGVGATALYQGYRYAKRRRRFKETDKKLAQLSSEGFGNVETGAELLETLNEEEAPKAAKRKAALRQANPTRRYVNPRGPTVPKSGYSPKLSNSLPLNNTPKGASKYLYKNSATSRLLRGAGKVAKPLQVATDVTRVANAYQADGNKIGRNTMVTAGNVIGAWLGIFLAGLLLTSVLGVFGIALGPIGFGVALAVSQAAGGMIGSELGSAAGGGAYDGGNFLGSTVDNFF